MEKRRVIVVICSSDLKPSHIQKLAEQGKPLVFVSTDWFYPNERQGFQKIFKEVSFYCFNDFLSDVDLEAVDNVVIDACKQWTGQEHYYGHFVKAQKFFKCKFLVESVQKRFKNLQLYYHPTPLGISTEYFKSIEAKDVNDLQLSAIEKYMKFKHELKIKLGLLEGKHEIESHAHHFPEAQKASVIAKVDVFKFLNSYFVILGGLKRLKNREGELVFSGKINLREWEKELHKICTEIKKGNLHFGVEGHSFKYEFANLLPQINLIADGYWPPNYTYSYHGIYPQNIQFTCLSETDELFCTNIKVLHNRLFNFLDSPLRLPENTAIGTESITRKSIVLLSQCTSEWTALINRSDTSKLIEAFANLAANLPDYNFIIRPHPGITLPVHDGEHSLERIHAFLSESHISNLSVSEKSLAEDFKKGDIFITEYSTAAFESMALGKVWISCNLTKRRNYFKYFTSLGFLHSETEAELHAVVFSVLKGDNTMLEKFSSAQQRYKTLF